MLTNRKLKDRIKELEGVQGVLKAYKEGMEAHRTQIRNMCGEFGASLRHGTYNHLNDNYLIEQCKEELEDLRVRMLELKAKAEKAESGQTVKSCPHCRGGYILAGSFGNKYYLYCHDCRMHGPEVNSTEEAFDAWNNLPRRT